MSLTCPIWLVVGFLGAGKTTLLRGLLKASRGRHLVYVINEFSAVDVDAGLIEKDGGVALAVPGGSIFCRCLISEFVGVLRRISDGLVGRDGIIVQPEGVVIEASGIADPRSMGRLLAESGLASRFHVAGVTAVVDPGTLMKLLLVLPNIRGQIESADLVLLNKCDLHSLDMIEKVREKIVRINPHATIIRCTRGSVDPACVLADGVSLRDAEVDAAFGLCKDPHYERESLFFKQPVDWDLFTKLFEGADDGLYRAKGCVKTNKGWMQIDWSAGVLSCEPVDSGKRSALTLIWSPSQSCKVAETLREMAVKD